MFATRWEPIFELDRLHRDLSRLAQGASRRTFSTAYPPLNLTEDGEHYFVEAELPGLALDDLEIHVAEGNQLSIQGERKVLGSESSTTDSNEQNRGDKKWHRQERGYGKFRRTVELPEVVDPDQVTATLSHGILTVSLAKSEKSKPRKIAITVED